MRHQTVATLVVTLLLVVTPVDLAVAQDEGQYIRGEPDLDMYVPESDLAPGSTSQLTLQVANNGRVRGGAATQRDMVTTARGVTVEVTDDGPFDVATQRQAIGSVPDGDVRDVPITITVPADVEPGEYSIDVRLRYTHTSTYAPESSVVQEQTRTVRTSVDVVVDDSARFALRTVESDVQVGDSGTLLTEVTNVGDELTRDITLELDSTTTDVLLGEGPRNTARIDSLEPGENTTVAFDASVRQGISVRNVTLDGAVIFTNVAGVQSTQEGLSTGLRPTDEQEFTLSVDESTLRVGELGTVRGTITNDGPTGVEHVVLSLGETQLEPRSRTYAVGDLDPGESATFQFRSVVPAEADAVPQRLDVTIAYRTTAGNDRTTTAPVEAVVADRRDAVSITPINATFVAGESGILELDVTNQRDEPISDVRIHLVVEEPLESDFRTTIIPSLQPGETDRVAFDLEVDSDAPESRFPATVNVTYTDPNDEPATARSSTIAVEVTADEAVLPFVEIAVVIAVLLLVGAGGWWFYGRRFV